MLDIFGKSVLGHLCFKCLKMIISANYAQNVLMIESCYAYR